MERLKHALAAIRGDRKAAGQEVMDGVEREGFAQALGEWVADALEGVVVLPEDF